jgi:hypothetical protein
MSVLDLPSISVNDFKVVPSHVGATIHLEFSGTAEGDAPAHIHSLLLRTHSEAKRLCITEVVVDFRNLEFMNSSSFKSFVAWLGQVEDSKSTDRYKIRFVSDSNKHWQRRSLAALSCFAVGIVTVDE